MFCEFFRHKPCIVVYLHSIFLKMKQIVSFISALFILVATTGVVATIHTCHDTITEVYFIDNHVDCCETEDAPCHGACELSQSMHSCCSNTSLLIKFDEELFVPTKFETVITPLVFDVYSEIIQTEFFETQSLLFYQYQYRPPPKQNLYTLFCSYIFYG